MTGTRQCVVVVDDDSTVTEALAFTLERPGRTVVLCSDIDAAEIALAHFPVTHMVMDVQFSGTFGFEGLHFVARVRKLAPECRIVLMTGCPTGPLRAQALRDGASAVLGKPFGARELETILGDTPDSEADYDVIRIPSLDELLGGDIRSVFQPIVHLTEEGTATFGYEALTRARGSWPAGGAAMLFDYAARQGRLAELNIAAMTQAVASAALLPEDTMLFIKVDPVVFDGRDLVASLRAASDDAAMPLERVVLEVTERSAFHDETIAAHVFDELRELGVRFALADHGSRYSHLSLIHRIRPSYIKIGQTFGTGFEHDANKEPIVRRTIDLARDFGCETILEGVETAATARAAAAAGVTLAQGFHFGRPRDAENWIAEGVADPSIFRTLFMFPTSAQNAGMPIS